MQIMLLFFNQFLNSPSICSTDAIAFRTSAGRRLIASMGFIDTLTYYDWKRAAESKGKTWWYKRQSTIQPPHIYSSRMGFTFGNKFIKDPVCLSQTATFHYRISNIFVLF